MSKDPTESGASLVRGRVDGTKVIRTKLKAVAILFNSNGTMLKGPICARPKARTAKTLTSAAFHFGHADFC